MYVTIPYMYCLGGTQSDPNSPPPSERKVVTPNAFAHTHTHFTVFSLQVGKINTAKQSADKGMSCASQISA